MKIKRKIEIFAIYKDNIRHLSLFACIAVENLLYK